jgi:nitroreductase
MEVLEAIRTRRTVGKIRPDPVPRALVEELLEAATWAPNHHLNEPWRFFVLAGAARERFGEVMAEDALAGFADTASEPARALADAQRKKAVRSPVIIAVASEPAGGPKIVELENVCAVACAIQNMLLAAHARGLAAKWSTGAPAFSDRVKRFFDLPADHQILGFIYLGYPDPSDDKRAVPRAGHREKVTWLGWD